MALATVSELKQDINLIDTDGKWTATLQRLLDAAERLILRTCNRPEGFVAGSSSARYYCGSGKPIQWIDEAAAITAVAVKDSPSDDEDSYITWTLGTVGTTTDADCFPASGAPEDPDYYHTPYTFLVIGANSNYSVFTSGSFTTRGGFKPSSTVARGVPTVKVTGQWGYALTVPADIKEACIMQSARWFMQLKSGKTDTVGSSEFGILMYRKVLDPDVEAILIGGRYIRPAIGRR